MPHDYSEGGRYVGVFHHDTQGLTAAEVYELGLRDGAELNMLLSMRFDRTTGVPSGTIMLRLTKPIPLGRLSKLAGTGERGDRFHERYIASQTIWAKPPADGGRLWQFDLDELTKRFPKLRDDKIVQDLAGETLEIDARHLRERLGV